MFLPINVVQYSQRLIYSQQLHLLGKKNSWVFQVLNLRTLLKMGLPIIAHFFNIIIISKLLFGDVENEDPEFLHYQSMKCIK